VSIQFTTQPTTSIVSQQRAVIAQISLRTLFNAEMNLTQIFVQIFQTKAQDHVGILIITVAPHPIFLASTYSIAVILRATSAALIFFHQSTVYKRNSLSAVIQITIISAPLCLKTNVSARKTIPARTFLCITARHQMAPATTSFQITSIALISTAQIRCARTLLTTSSAE